MTTKELSTVVKTFYAILKDGRHIPIDEIDKMHIENAKANNRFSAFIQIWSGKNKYNGEVSQIIEIAEVRRQKYAWKWYYCDFWQFHPVHESCACVNKYRIPPIAVRSLAEIRYKKHPKLLSQTEFRSIIEALS